MKQRRLIVLTFAIIITFTSKVTASNNKVKPLQRSVPATEVHDIGGFAG